VGRKEEETGDFSERTLLLSFTRRGVSWVLEAFQWARPTFSW